MWRSPPSGCRCDLGHTWIAYPLARRSALARKETSVMAFPALNHVALTVRDMAVSGPWYRRLLDADPVVDEHTAAGFRHLVWILDGGTVFGIHQHEHQIGRASCRERV